MQFANWCRKFDDLKLLSGFLFKILINQLSLISYTGKLETGKLIGLTVSVFQYIGVDGYIYG